MCAQFHTFTNEKNPYKRWIPLKKTMTEDEFDYSIVFAFLNICELCSYYNKRQWLGSYVDRDIFRLKMLKLLLVISSVSTKCVTAKYKNLLKKWRGKNHKKKPKSLMTNSLLFPEEKKTHLFMKYKLLTRNWVNNITRNNTTPNFQ